MLHIVLGKLVVSPERLKALVRFLSRFTSTPFPFVATDWDAIQEQQDIPLVGFMELIPERRSDRNESWYAAFTLPALFFWKTSY